MSGVGVGVAGSRADRRAVSTSGVLAGRVLEPLFVPQPRVNHDNVSANEVHL